MKRLTALLCAFSLCLLCACGSRSAQPFSTDLVDKLLESDVFSEPLEPLEDEIACFVYQLDAEQSNLTDLKAYRSSGATCEEVALFIFADETAAQTAANILDLYVAGQIQANKDYRPAEIPKLEQAFLERRGTTVLLMVANDYQATYELLAP